ncbi:MAG TPA: DoxX family protein [Bdellovibrionota bacterium]|jgi:uncharacterized membrane protein YphA (DoxX/SURF4 family)
MSKFLKKLPLIARLLLGFIFFGSGLAGFLVPPPPNLPEKIQAFFTGLQSTGFFLPLLKGTEVTCGLLLLSGYYVPLALVVLAPIAINILLVHTFLEPSGLPMALVVVVLEGYLAFFAKPYKDVVGQLFKNKK